MIKVLLKQVGEYKRVTIFTPILAAIEVFLETLIPFITASLIDKGLNAGNFDEVIKYGAIMVGAAALSLTAAVLCGRFAAKASTGFAANLRRTMYSHIQSFSFSNIDRFSTSGLITRMTTDVTSVQNAFQMSIRMAFRAPLTLISSLIMCLAINARMSLIFIGAILLLVLIFALVIPKVVKIFAVVFEKYDALNMSVQENVTAIRVVKAFVREEHETDKFDLAAQALYNYSVKAEGIMALLNPVMMFVINGCILLISWFGAHLILSGDLTTGELTSLFSYISSVFTALMMLSMVTVMITMSGASVKRIAEVIDENADITNPENPVTEIRDGSISFKDVSFKYNAEGNGEEILKDINLDIKAGETIGVIGGTGSGKTSLVNLISRLYDVTGGSVCVGGNDVRIYDIVSLRDAVSVVLQKNVLFSGTVIENLRWGKADATEEECRRVCGLACIDDFISSQPDGYNMKIEQGGSNLSGGQRQRLCIARALIKNPKVLILDDSTSAVDTATDASIRKAFREYIPEVTKIIIAQRISSVMDADRIIVMDNGSVAGFDTHEQLLETNDIYREIYETQIESGGDFDEAAAPTQEERRAARWHMAETE